MLFKPELVAKILADEKTQTRRGVQLYDVCLGEGGGIFRDGQSVQSVWNNAERPRLRYSVGKTYAIQPGRGKAAVAHFLLEQIRYCARAGEITPEDALSEGFATPEEFRQVYARLNGADALDKPCWCLTFSLIEDEEEQ